MLREGSSLDEMKPSRLAKAEFEAQPAAEGRFGLLPDRFRYVVLLVALLCLTSISANVQAFNFAIVCMSPNSTSGVSVQECRAQPALSSAAFPALKCRNPFSTPARTPSCTTRRSSRCS